MAAKGTAHLNRDASPKAAGRRRSRGSVRPMRRRFRPLSSGTGLAWIGPRRQRRDRASLTSKPKGARRDTATVLDLHRAGAGGPSPHREGSVQSVRGHDPRVRRRSNRSSCSDRIKPCSDRAPTRLNGRNDRSAWPPVRASRRLSTPMTVGARWREPRCRGQVRGHVAHTRSVDIRVTLRAAQAVAARRPSHRPAPPTIAPQRSFAPPEAT